MALGPKNKLDGLVRRERLKNSAIALFVGGGASLVLIIFLVKITSAQSNPLGQKYIPGTVVSTKDVSSGNGTAFEVVARFSGLQRVFLISDPVMIADHLGRVCILETRGTFVGAGVPPAKYHDLTDPAKCEPTE